MARTRRICYPGLIYHVINRGNNGQTIFKDSDDYKKYLGLLYRYKKKMEFKLFAFCLMTNHVHLLLKSGKKYTISQFMQGLTTAHTRHYHDKYQTTGHVWQGRFKSPIVSNDEYLLTVMQYIEQNPIRAKMVRGIQDYLWTSYKLNSRLKISKLIDRNKNPVFVSLGKNDKERTDVYCRLIKKHISEKQLSAIRKSVKGGSAYVSKQFKTQIIAILPKRKGRGRPRKMRDKMIDQLCVKV